MLAAGLPQSAGAVTINATQRIDNSVVRVNQAGAGTINARGDATADARQAQTQVRALNPQLPPDLAQRQVNPVTLPSFSLPQGSNGLFRETWTFAHANGTWSITCAHASNNPNDRAAGASRGDDVKLENGQLTFKQTFGQKPTPTSVDGAEYTASVRGNVMFLRWRNPNGGGGSVFLRKAG